MNPADGNLPVGDVPANVSAIRLAGLVRDDSARILANWSMRISMLPAFRAVPELALAELQEDMPELLDAIMVAVNRFPYEFGPEPMEAVATKAAAHGAIRAETFTVDVVLAEMHVLQREVRNSVWRNAGEFPASVLHEFDDRLNEVFEMAEQSIVAAWVERHDQLPILLRHGDAA
jgi:hypothetical protein